MSPAKSCSGHLGSRLEQVRPVWQRAADPGIFADELDTVFVFDDDAMTCPTGTIMKILLLQVLLAIMGQP